MRPLPGVREEEAGPAAGAGLLDLGRTRRQRYVAGFSLGYFALTTVGAALVHALFVPELPYWKDPVALAANGLGGVCLLAYTWARRGDTVLAGRVLVAGLFLAVWIATIGALDLAYGSAIIIYLTLAPLFAGFLSSPSVTVATGLANLVGLVLLAGAGAITYPEASDVGILVSAITLMGAVGAQVRVYDEATIQEQAGRLVAHAQELEAIIETTGTATYLVDDDGTIRLANHAALEETPGAIGKAIDDVFREEMREVAAFLLEASRSGEGGQTDVRPEGGRQLEVSIRPMPQGLGHLLVLVDTSDRLAREERRRIVYEHNLELEKLREMNRFKANLLSSASHELNTPLTPIRLQLELLKTPERGPLTPAQTRSLDIIDRSTRKLGALVQDILDVARLEQGRLDLFRSQVSLDALLVDQAKLLEGLAHQGRVEIRLDIGDPVWVDGDARRLAQVVGHLIENAIRFSSPDGHVQAGITEEPGQVRVWIRDDGVGIPEAARTQLFQPFVQFEEHQGRTGTGLGLYISKGIVEAHGGAIGYQALDRGSLFWFTIPTTDDS